MKVVCVTSNPGKVRELAKLLESIEVEWLPMWLGEVEVGSDYHENAILKARAALRTIGRAVLTEDAGLEVDALGGRPGPWSARFAGPGATDASNVKKLLRLLDGVEERSARYRSVAVLLTPDGTLTVGEGTWEGRIATVPRGDGGFGYDPVFISEGENRTAAELTAAEKNAASHRGAALRSLQGHLE